MRSLKRTLLAVVCLALAGCPATPQVTEPTVEPAAPAPDYYGTLEPFASEAVYFVLTDRFVDGDPENNQLDQGGAERGTFDRPIQIEGEPPAWDFARTANGSSRAGGRGPTGTESAGSTRTTTAGLPMQQREARRTGRNGP